MLKTVQTLPDGPAFYAYSNTTQSVSNITFTKVALNTEVFDTDNAFNTTLNRFLPTRAGYYQINAGIFHAAATAFGTGYQTIIYKNGSLYSGSTINVTSGAVNGILTVSTLVYLNGTTDFIELYGYAVGAVGAEFVAGISYSYMNGTFVRG